MRNPVKIQNGDTFEKEAIFEWFQISKNLIHPITLKPISSNEIIQDISLRVTIRRFIQKYSTYFTQKGLFCIMNNNDGVNVSDVDDVMEWFESGDGSIDDFIEIYNRDNNDMHFLTKFGCFGRNILHYSVIYLDTNILCDMIDFIHRWIDDVIKSNKKKWETIVDMLGISLSTSAAQFFVSLILQKDDKQRSPLEYSIIYGSNDLFQRFEILSSYISDITIVNTIIKETKDVLIEEKLIYQYCTSSLCKIGDITRVNILFNLGVVPNDKHETLYHVEVASGYSKLDLLKFMLKYAKEKNIDMIECCNDALCASAANGLIESAKVLLSYGNDVNINMKCKNFRRYCSFAISAASFYGHIDFVKFLLKMGVNVNQIYLGTCALNSACSNDHPNLQLIKLLIKNKAIINPQLKKVSESPLMIVSKRGNLEIAKYLIEKGAKINTQNSMGNTPLHLAIKYRNWDVIKLLVRKGAKEWIKNRVGKTPVMLINEDNDFKNSVEELCMEKKRS